MATGIIGRNFEVTPDVKQLLEKKLARITKLFDDVIDIRCVLQVEKYRNICEILITGKEHDVKTVQESDDSMQDAVNSALDHLKRQAQKNRKKIRDHHRKEGNGRIFYEAHGHSERIYAMRPMLEHVIAGLQYALGDLKADDSPSVKK